MKKITYTIGFAFAVLASSNAVAQQGFGTNRPDRSAAVEIKSSNKGLLIPRVVLTDLSSKSTPINNPANSLLIYNIGSADSGTTNTITAGYYYFSEPKGRWIPILDGDKISNGNGTLINFDSNTGITKIDLGGTLTKKVEIVTSDSNTFALQGLKTISDLTGKNVLISDTGTGVIETVTVADLLGTNTVNSLVHDTATLNTMVSTVNGVSDSSLIILTNELIETSTADTNTSITSLVNGVPSVALDLEPIVQAGQIKYNVLSSDSSVAVTKIDSSTTNNLVTYDISVAETKAKNGLSIDSGTVVLGGALDRNTIINADTNTLAITGLKDDTSTTNYMVVVDGNGVLKRTQMGSNNAVEYINGNGSTFALLPMHETIIVNTDTGFHTIQLPLANDDTVGKRYYIKKVGTNEVNALTITVDGGGNIDGTATGLNGDNIISTLPYQSWIFQNGGNANGWFIVGQ